MKEYTFIVAVETNLAIMISDTISIEDAERSLRESGYTTFEITLRAETPEKAVEKFQMIASKLDNK